MTHREKANNSTAIYKRPYKNEHFRIICPPSSFKFLKLSSAFLGKNM